MNRKIMIICWLMLFFCQIALTNAEETIALDGEREEEYILYYNHQDFVIYKYNEYIFIESQYQIQNITLNGEGFTTYNYTQNSELDRIEIQYLENFNKISIKIQYNNKEITLELPIATATPEGWDLLADLKRAAPFLGWILVPIIFLIQKIRTDPWIFVQSNKRYGEERLGRITYQEFDKELKKWKLYFKNTGGIDIIWSDYSKEDILSKFCFSKFLGFYVFAPHLILIKVKVPGGLKIPEYKEIENSFQNKLMYFMYRFAAVFIPYKSITFQIFNKLKWKKQERNMYGCLISEWNLDSLEHLFNVEYEIKVHNPNTGEDGWVKREEEEITWIDILNIKQSKKIRKFKKEHVRVHTKHYRSLKEAMNDKKTRREDRAYFEYRNHKLQGENTQLSKSNDILTDRLNQQKLSEQLRFSEKIGEINKVNDSLQNDLPRLIAEGARMRSIGIPEFQSLENVLKGYIDKTITNESDLRNKIAKLEGVILALKNNNKTEIPDLDLTKIIIEEINNGGKSNS